MPPKIIIPLNSAHKKPLSTRFLTTQPSKLMMYHPLNETTGTVARNNAPGRIGWNIIPNPGFEAAGAGGADVFDQWGESAGDGAIADETTVKRSGGHAAKLTAGSTGNTYVYNILTVVPGDYNLSIWTRGDGTNSARLVLYDQTHGAFIRNNSTLGVTGTTYTKVDVPFTVPAGCVQVQFQFYCPAANGGVCYFDDISCSSAIADPTVFDGIYTGGFTLGQPGYAGNSVLLNGSTGYVWMRRAAIANSLPAAAGSYIIYGKTTLAALTDGFSRWLVKFKSVDALNYIDCFKDSNNNKLGWQYRDDTSGQIFKNTDWTTDLWFSMGCTWSVANGMNHFLNGVKIGTSSAIGGAMTHPINYGIMALGVGIDGPAGWWIGNLQHFGMWDAELSAAEMARLGR